MRRVARLAALSIVACALTASAATSAAPPKRYYELAVDARFYSQTDHGADERQQMVGAHTYTARFSVRVLALFANRRLAIVPKAASVAGVVTIEDRRMEVVDFTTRQRAHASAAVSPTRSTSTGCRPGRAWRCGRRAAHASRPASGSR